MKPGAKPPHNNEPANPNLESTNKMPDTLPYPKFNSIEDFYQERGGIFSQEKDYGVNNADADPSRIQRYQVSVVADTGDVYAHQIYYPRRAYRLGQIPGADYPLNRAPSAVPPVYNEADRIFAGWNESAAGQSLEWFYRKLQEPGWAAELTSNSNPAAAEQSKDPETAEPDPEEKE